MRRGTALVVDDGRAGETEVLEEEPELEPLARVFESRGIAVTQRKVRGDGIAAACGQLKLREDSVQSERSSRR